MKTKILSIAMAVSLLTIGCNDDKENNNVPITVNEAQANSQMDDITEDVLYIAESESNEISSGRGRGASFLNNCATFDTEVLDGIVPTWRRTIDFGSENCTLFNGNEVRGKIILTFTADFEANIRTISYAFEDFYHNDRKVSGDREVVRRILENGHPQATISLNMSVTTTNGTVYTRVGERVREFTSGYDTPLNLFDNQFSITGTWTTSISATGQTFATTINAPLIIKWTCPYIMSGTVTVVRGSDGATAVLDYGDGECDDDATLTINGIVHDINL